MHRAGVLSIVLVVFSLLAPAGAGAGPRTAPDCRFDDARAYQDFGRIRVFTAQSGLYGCLTDVGRAHRLNTGTMRARSAPARRAIFGISDWVGFPARTRSGEIRVRATNLRTGRTHAATAADPVTALIVNFDGTLAWIAGTQLRTKAVGERTRALGSDAAIDRRFLGLESDQGCAVTWRVAGEQRSSSIHCTRP
jgi:hypothetical protein